MSIVCIYNQTIDRTLITLESVIMQRNVLVQVRRGMKALRQESKFRKLFVPGKVRMFLIRRLAPRRTLTMWSRM